MDKGGCWKGGVRQDGAGEGRGGVRTLSVEVWTWAELGGGMMWEGYVDEGAAGREEGGVGGGGGGGGSHTRGGRGRSAGRKLRVVVVWGVEEGADGGVGSRWWGGVGGEEVFRGVAAKRESHGCVHCLEEMTFAPSGGRKERARQEEKGGKTGSKG